MSTLTLDGVLISRLQSSTINPVTTKDKPFVEQLSSPILVVLCFQGLFGAEVQEMGQAAVVEKT